MRTRLAGLGGLGSAEVRSEPLPRRIAIHIAAEVVEVGRASGYEIEPIYGIAAQRFVDAVEGRGLADVERDMAAGAPHLSRGAHLLAGEQQPARGAGALRPIDFPRPHGPDRERAPPAHPARGRA